MSETGNQKRIREILDDKEEASDHSLRSHAMERALKDTVPKTMTPWEWEQWYAEHGVPDSHRKPERQESPPRSWWQRLRHRVLGSE